MQPLFAQRRKPRRVARESDGEDEGPAVVRPGKSTTSRRVAYTNTEPDEDDGTAVVLPLARKSFKNRAAIPLERLPERGRKSGPAYTLDVLAELKSSTPSAPVDQGNGAVTRTAKHELDLMAKFGKSAIEIDTLIPTTAEILEKKARRRRLAKEQEYITLNSDGEPEDERDGLETDSSASSSDHEASIRPYMGLVSRGAKSQPSRTLQDEDELGEGYDHMLADKLTMGKKAERDAARRQKEDMKAMIEDAEGSKGSSEDESDTERQAAYQNAQAQRGLDGLHKGHAGPRPQRSRTPPRVTPLPTLGGIVERLQEQREGKLLENKILQTRLQSVQQELADIEVRKAQLQDLITVAAERYARLKAEVVSETTAADTTKNTDMQVVRVIDQELVELDNLGNDTQNGGLESNGNAGHGEWRNSVPEQDHGVEDVDVDVEEERPFLGRTEGKGLGFA